MYLYQAAPLALAHLATLDSTAKLPRTPLVTPTTPVPTKVSVPCCPSTNTSASVPEDGQDHSVSMRTAAYLVPVPTVECAALSPVVATHAPVLQVTQVCGASMTPTNVLPHLLYARMKENASTPLDPTSVTVPRGLLAGTVKAHTSLAHPHHA